jgi:hypothetical protein
MSFEEIVEELPKLTTEEKERLRQLLNTELSWTEEEEQAINEGFVPAKRQLARLGKSSIDNYEISLG